MARFVRSICTLICFSGLIYCSDRLGLLFEIYGFFEFLGFWVCSLRFIGFLRFMHFCMFVVKELQEKRIILKKKNQIMIFLFFLSNQACSLGKEREELEQ